MMTVMLVARKAKMCKFAYRQNVVGMMRVWLITAMIHTHTVYTVLHNVSLCASCTWQRVKQCLIEDLNTKTNVITLKNQNKCNQLSYPIRT